MSTTTYDKQSTALLVIDPYNDFISEGGKVWNRLKAVADANNCIPNMLQVLNASRMAKLCVFYALHHRYRPGDFETWKYVSPIQKAAWMRNTFDKKFTPELKDTASLNNLTPEQVIVLASLVEREMNISVDRPIIAGI